MVSFAMSSSDESKAASVLPGFSSALVKWILGLLVVLALASTLVGVHNALQPERSQDIQWSGVRLLFVHIDPWAEFLRGDPDHRLILTQIPNYLPALYVLLIPLGFLPLMPAKIVWILCNILFAIVSGTLAARFYGLRGRGWTLAVVCFLLIATPTRNTIGNGQQGLLILLLWCLSLLSSNLTNGRSAGAGLSYLKFNFAPATFLYLCFRGGIRAILFSAVPCAVATLLVWLWLAGVHSFGSLAHLVEEPFAVTRTGYFPSGIDTNLMDVLETVLVRLHLPLSIVNPITFLTALLLCAAVLYTATRRRRSSAQWQLALMALMSFSLFKHHTYDGVVLLLPFCYALRLMQDVRARTVLILLAFVWYVERIIDAVAGHLEYFYILTWFVLMVVLYLVWNLHSTEQQTEPQWQLEPGVGTA